MKVEFAPFEGLPPEAARLAITLASRFAQFTGKKVGGYDFEAVDSAYLSWQKVSYFKDGRGTNFQIESNLESEQSRVGGKNSQLLSVAGSGALALRCPQEAIAGIYAEYEAFHGSTHPKNYVLVIKDEFFPGE